MAKVDRVRTPLTEADIADALRVGHDRVLERPADGEAFERRLGVAWAHVCLENGHGRDIFGFNLGNHTCPHDYAGDYYAYVTDERIQQNPDVWRKLELRYPVSASAEDGAELYWLQFVVGRGRYASALPLFDAGRAFDAGMALHSLGYYTAREVPYSTTMAALYNEWIARRP